MDEETAYLLDFSAFLVNEFFPEQAKEIKIKDLLELLKKWKEECDS